MKGRTTLVGGHLEGLPLPEPLAPAVCLEFTLALFAKTEVLGTVAGEVLLKKPTELREPCFHYSLTSSSHTSLRALERETWRQSHAQDG